jgi:hypothetical protein
LSDFLIDLWILHRRQCLAVSESLDHIPPRQ